MSYLMSDVTKAHQLRNLDAAPIKQCQLIWKLPILSDDKADTTTPIEMQITTGLQNGHAVSINPTRNLKTNVQMYEQKWTQTNLLNMSIVPATKKPKYH